MPAALYYDTLEEVQFAQEAAFGDAAVPTLALGGVTKGSLIIHNEGVQIRDKRATSMPAYINAIGKRWGEANLEGVFTYTQGMYLLNAMFAVDAATPFAYIAALTPAAPGTWNLLYGQSGLCYSMAGGLMDSLTIRGDNNGPLTYSAHFQGKMPVADVREALTIPTLLIAQGGTTVLSIDPIATAHGTTPLALTNFSFEANYTNSRHILHHTANMEPDNYAHGVWGGSLKLKLEMTAATKAYLTALLAATVEQVGYNVRLVTTGTGTAALTQDWSGQLLTVPQLYTYENGVNTLEFELAPAYSAQAAQLTCYKLNLVAS